ncbi:MAG TPA: hypothetical protein VLM79_18140 [Kofleriaceae bacterium]|nr:hypothetical protein [Kofleriaceae bacterium]
MTNGFPNQPKTLRGAFVEYGLTLPPAIVVFQFNPLQLTRNRSLTYTAPSSGTSGAAAAGGQTLRSFHKRYDDLTELRDAQQVTVGEETIGFDIRLDATDQLDEGDPLAEQFGILPRLSTLEAMVYPKDESLLGQALGALLGSPGGFSFTRAANPPLILFIWGRTRVLPVNINSMNITETEFSAVLNPVRATVAVSLTVIEGKSPFYLYSKAAKEAMSVLNLANLGDISDVVVPG